MQNRKKTIKQLLIITTIAFTFTFFNANFTKVQADSWWNYPSGWYLWSDSGNYWKTGWQWNNNNWYYMQSNGQMQIGWQYYNGYWYYLDGNGAMLTGWQYINGKWYLFNRYGSMFTGWQYYNGYWYYLNPSGDTQTGWMILNKDWYYFNQYGSMWNRSTTINGKNYVFNSMGVLQSYDEQNSANNIKNAFSYLATLGDSVTEGYNGTTVVRFPIANILNQSSGLKTINLGIGGGTITNTTYKDLQTVVANTDFSQFDAATIAYGINDLDGMQTTLPDVEEKLTEEVTKIREKNPRIRLFGILPSYAVTNQAVYGGPGGYNYDQLCDGLATTYKELKIPSLDWRTDPVVTASNANQTTGDHWIHPTQTTYYQMALQIQNFISQNTF